MDQAPPPPALLVIDDLAVAYRGGSRVLEHLTLSLERGEIGCLVGSSGCGKTTLLRAIAGFLPVAAGTIEEKVMALQRRKARLFRAVLDDDGLFGQALEAD